MRRDCQGLSGAVRAVAAAGMALACLWPVAGCKPREPIVPESFLPPPVETDEPLPAYSEVVERYNANLAGLDRLWAASQVQIRWRDEDGDARLEEGDGKLLYVGPDHVALTVEKLGKTYLWAGSDEERFWMFDNQDRIGYVGRHRNVGKACMRELPLPVHPSTVPYLLGLVPLDPHTDDPGVERLEGHLLIEPPGLRLRMLLDPATARPVRVDLTDGEGKSVVIARLGEPAPVALAGEPRPAPPTVATRADLFVPGREARMTLRLSRLSDGREGNRIREQAFDFDTLVKAHKPREVIVLDAACGGVGAAPEQMSASE